MMNTYMNAVSLFSNCGAGDIGYRKAGFEFQVMAELESSRLEVCILNHPEATPIVGDLRDTWEQVINTYRIRTSSSLDLLAACPPCQGVSSARGNRGKGNNPDDGMKDERNLLAVIIANVAKVLIPKIIVVENVPAFLTRQVRHPDTGESISAADLLISILRLNYYVFPLLTDLSEYGVPQSRKRMFLTFLRRDLDILEQLLSRGLTPYPIPIYTPENGAEPIKLVSALSQLKLPSLDAASPEKANCEEYKGWHSVPVWDDEKYQMIATIPPNSGKSAWENNSCLNCQLENIDKNEAICPRCSYKLPRPIIKQHDGQFRLIKGFHSSSYRRMLPDRPASTITTGSGHIGSHFTIHPFENRLFSPLECAHLQTFPEDFNWGDALEKWGHTNIRQMIGEAVPPLFTEKHGMILKSLLEGNISSQLLSSSDTRCQSAQRKLYQLRREQ